MYLWRRSLQVWKQQLQLQPDVSWTSCTCRGKTSLSASNVKSTGFYQCIKECEWRIKITKLADRHTWKWMEKQWNRAISKMFSILRASNMTSTSENEWLKSKIMVIKHLHSVSEWGCLHAVYMISNNVCLSLAWLADSVQSCQKQYVGTLSAGNDSQCWTSLH